MGSFWASKPGENVCSAENRNTYAEISINYQLKIPS